MIRPFSKRHERAIYDRRLSISLGKRLRRRVWYLLQRFDFEFEKQDYSGYRCVTNVVDEVEAELKTVYGVASLTAYVKDDERATVTLEGFVMGGYPSQVLDVVEVFYSEISENDRARFNQEVNEIFAQESSAWRMTDGQFFKVDSEFLSLELVARSYELLKAEGFEGALDEFNEARNDLNSGDFKGAILNACKSFESTLKTILGAPSGTASQLVRSLKEWGFFHDFPNGMEAAFGEQVLGALPFLRNRLAGHGQGESPVLVTRSQAELALHLAASFIFFSVNQAINSGGRESRSKPKREEPEEDEIPF